LLFSMVQQEGLGKTAIFVGGDSNRALARYDEPARPADRRDDGIGRSAYPPEPGMPPGAGRNGNAAARYPPEPQQPVDPPMSPHCAGWYVDGLGASSAGPDARPYYDPDPYADGRSAPRVPPDSNADPYADGRGAPQGHRVPFDYAVDPYADIRG